MSLVEFRRVSARRDYTRLKMGTREVLIYIRLVQLRRFFDENTTAFSRESEQLVARKESSVCRRMHCPRSGGTKRTDRTRDVPGRMQHALEEVRRKENSIPNCERYYYKPASRSALKTSEKRWSKWTQPWSSRLQNPEAAELKDAIQEQELLAMADVANRAGELLETWRF